MGEDTTQENARVRLSVASEKLKSAQILFNNGMYADAVSRAYYAMYYAAAALLITKNLTPKTHQGILNLFGQHFVSQGIIDKSYATMLRIVKERREDADYEPLTTLTKEEAEDALKKAEEFIQRCTSIIYRTEAS